MTSGTSKAQKCNLFTRRLPYNTALRQLELGHGCILAVIRFVLSALGIHYLYAGIFARIFRRSGWLPFLVTQDILRLREQKGERNMEWLVSASDAPSDSLAVAQNVHNRESGRSSGDGTTHRANSRRRRDCVSLRTEC